MAKRKPGKYDHLLHKFKKQPPEDLKQQEKINHRKVTLRTCPRCDGRKVELMECNYCTLDVALFSVNVECHACGGTRKLDTADACHVCHGTGEWELTATRLADLYVIARADADTIARAASVAGVELEALTQLLIDSQENQMPEWGAFGASDRSLKMANGDVIRVQPELYGTVKDKAAFRAWCYKNGQATAMELPEKKTQDLVKARALVAELEPDGIEIFTRAKIVYTPLKTEASTTQTTTDDDSINAF